ncbi:Crp/Fnr family transcriptional regulator [Ferruginibacter albus]|uniref:Crp/Fnr family transcriptional regulator n=1 Tax=Ferruginibacter albus TaxID=2875540 RepID=UPI001CC64B09|nr:Crp/Fnr family transcriptional regulator [Ferruginibacter albus]UAY51851.1 Crp/Fnr family transcriptional regulator [Ferruginibacter albus]
MFQKLKDHIARFVEIDEKDYAEVLEYFTIINVSKKQNLLTEGKICKSNYFVSKGCLRMFFINDKGIEQTIQFALENWWLADYTSFSSQQPSGFYIQAVEKCEIITLDFSRQEELLQRFPQMERYFRLIHQRAHSAFQFRIKFLYDLSREELYNDFSRSFPEFVQRIPQYLLASYLGFTPEYLSEIRNKRIS